MPTENPNFKSLDSIPEADSSLNPEIKRRVVPLSDLQKQVITSLFQRNKDGTLKYTHSGDRNLILEVYRKSHEDLSREELEKKIINERSSTLQTAKRMAFRFRVILAGGRNVETEAFFEDLQREFPGLTLERAIELLLRKGARIKKGELNPENKRRPRIIVLPDAVPPVRTAVTKTGTAKKLIIEKKIKPVELPNEITEPDPVTVPLPEFPKSDPKKTLSIKEQLVYSLMELNKSGTGFRFLDLEEVASFYHFNVEKTQIELSNFLASLKQYRPRDYDLGFYADRSELEGFVDWAQDQPLYEGTSTDELARILRREASFQEVVENYKEFQELNKKSAGFKIQGKKEPKASRSL